MVTIILNNKEYLIFSMAKDEEHNYEENMDIYNEEEMEEAVEGDEISEQEEGFLRGYEESAKKKKKSKK